MRNGRRTAIFGDGYNVRDFHVILFGPRMDCDEDIRDLQLRSLEAADEPRLWEALYYALYVPPGAPPCPPETVRRPELARYVDNWMRREGDLGFAAHCMGDTIGAAWIRIWVEKSPGFGFVDAQIPELSMAVWPGHRGRGVGTALLIRTLDAAARNHAAVSLSVGVTNPALRLYERFGFQVVDQPARDSVTMLKPLNDGKALDMR